MVLAQGLQDGYGKIKYIFGVLHNKCFLTIEGNAVQKKNAAGMHSAKKCFKQMAQTSFQSVK